MKSCASVLQSSFQVVMADGTKDSVVLHQECDVQPGSLQKEKQQEEPGEQSSKGGKEHEDSNIYPYIKEDLFTSEIFKVQVQNLPRHVSFNDLKKFLRKQGLNPHKIKLMQFFAFVTFKNQVGFISVSC